MSILSYLSLTSRPRAEVDFSRMYPYSTLDEAALASGRRAFAYGSIGHAEIHSARFRFHHGILGA
jgi:hypothetical protein